LVPHQQSGKLSENMGFDSNSISINIFKISDEWTKWSSNEEKGANINPLVGVKNIRKAAGMRKSELDNLPSDLAEKGYGIIRENISKFQSPFSTGYAIVPVSPVIIPSGS